MVVSPSARRYITLSAEGIWGAAIYGDEGRGSERARAETGRKNGEDWQRTWEGKRERRGGGGEVPVSVPLNVSTLPPFLPPAAPRRLILSRRRWKPSQTSRIEATTATVQGTLQQYYRVKVQPAIERNNPFQKPVKSCWNCAVDHIRLARAQRVTLKRHRYWHSDPAMPRKQWNLSMFILLTALRKQTWHITDG